MKDFEEYIILNGDFSSVCLDLKEFLRRSDYVRKSEFFSEDDYDLHTNYGIFKRNELKAFFYPLMDCRYNVYYLYLEEEVKDYICNKLGIKKDNLASFYEEFCQILEKEHNKQVSESLNFNF